MSLLTLENVFAAYDKNIILKGINLAAEEGELVSLLGPSGCGKTTTLRVIAGFLKATKGRLIFNDKDFTHIPINKRHFGFVFQNYALFPHLTVFDNIAFGLRLRKVNRHDIELRVKQIMATVNLAGLGKRFPAELSGGQRQRVAIARALVIKPDLLLFDEPLSNLDANLRIAMRVEIRRIQQELGITAIYVSHDQEECFSISDKVAILNKGAIEQVDRPEVIYKRPQTEFVARFIGFTNLIHCTERHENQRCAVLTAKTYRFKINQALDSASKRAMKLIIRPDDIIIQKQATSSTTGDEENKLPGRIKISTFLGRSYQYEVATPLGSFQVNQETESPFPPGTSVTLTLPVDKLIPVD